MSGRLDKNGLLAEYGAEIGEMQREAVDEAVAPLNAQVTEMTATIAERDAAIEAKDAEIKTLTDDKAEVEARVSEMEKERDEAKKTAAEATLAGYRDELVTEMKLVPSAAKRVGAMVPLNIVDGDDAELTQSKAAVKTAADQALADVTEMAKEMGGKIKADGKPAGKGKGTDVSETKVSNGDTDGAVTARGGRASSTRSSPAPSRPRRSAPEHRDQDTPYAER